MITIYGVTLSPYVRKAAAALIEKGLEFDVKPVMPGDNSAEFRKISPFGRIPAFQDDDFAFADSTAILSYLDKKTPNPAMYPSEAKDLARTVWFEEFADTQLIPAIVSYFTETFIKPKFQNAPTDHAKANEHMKGVLEPYFEYLESQLSDGSLFLVNGALSAADLAIATGFINLNHVGYAVDKSRFPKLSAYLGHVMSRPSFMRLYADEKKMVG